jgi:hypothetical protein
MAEEEVSMPRRRSQGMRYFYFSAFSHHLTCVP